MSTASTHPSNRLASKPIRHLAAITKFESEIIRNDSNFSSHIARRAKLEIEREIAKRCPECLGCGNREMKSWQEQSPIDASIRILSQAGCVYAFPICPDQARNPCGEIALGSLNGDLIAGGTITAEKLSWSKLDAKGLTVKDANGNVILDAGAAQKAFENSVSWPERHAPQKPKSKDKPISAEEVW